MATGETALASVQARPVGRERLLFLGLLGAFVFSGASGLILQVVWVRMLSLVFGVTAYAISTVLSSFFSGLALGSFLSGRVADRLRRPLRAYAAAEALVAVCGLLTPAAFALARTAFVATAGHLPSDSLGPLTAVRFLLSFALLLVPSTLMGATLPLVLRSSLTRAGVSGAEPPLGGGWGTLGSPSQGEGFARNLSLLYAANTFGAMGGCFTAGFLLIGRYGLHASLIVAACCNLLAGGVAMAMDLTPRPSLRSAGSPLADARTPRRALKGTGSRRVGGRERTDGGAPSARRQGSGELFESDDPAAEAAGAGLGHGLNRPQERADSADRGFLSRPPRPLRALRGVRASARGDPADLKEGRGVRSIALLVFGVSGGVSLAYEVVWARVLAMFFDASTYGFTAMLTMVLLGIGAGSWLISPVIGRRWRWSLVLAGIEGAVGVLGLAALPLFTHLIPIGERLGLYHDPGPLGEFSVRFMAFSAFLVVFPPMLLLGASFPIAAVVVGTEGGVGRRVGGVYAVNVFGGIIGSLAGGFLLVPRLGVQGSLLLLACINLALAAVMAWAALGGVRRAALPALAAAAVGVVGVAAAPDLLRDIFRDRFVNQQVIWVDEGLENTVAVTDSLLTDERRLYINGQPQASSTGFVAAYHQLIGHLPMLLHPDPRRALVVGLGGGGTAGALSAHSGTEVDLVELSSAVTHAAPLFASVNGGVLERPNVHLRVDDGRNYLLVSGRRYDVITADIIRPEHAGATNLYSREYFELARDALTDDGIMVQWLEQLSEEHYRILMRSFLEVFPNVTLWANGSLLVGSMHPLTLDRATLARRLADPSARAGLAAIGLNTPDDVLALYTGNRDEALRYIATERRAITDDHPYVEFHRTLGGERRPPDLSGFSRDINEVLR